MKKFDAILSSTQIDAHGEMMSKGALESAAAALKKHYIPMGVEHDPRNPPIGRFTDAWVEESADGIFLLKGVGDLFENSDVLPPTIDKMIIEKQYTDGGVHLTFDRTYDTDEDQKDIAEICDHLGTKPQYEIKKAVEPLSVLTIGAGAFVFGSIASGFLKEIGADGYKLLKSKLSGMIERQKSKSKEQLIVFEFTVSRDDVSILVQTLLINPTRKDIEAFLDHQIYDLDALPLKAFDPESFISRVVYFFKNNKLEFKYAVRKDGFPVTIKPTTET